MIKRSDKVAYQLKLPLEAQLHPVFHVLCLKWKLCMLVTLLPSLPLVDEEGALQLESELILDRCVHQQGDWPLTEALVQWNEMLRKNSTWVPFWRLRNLYPHLVGKVF